MDKIIFLDIDGVVNTLMISDQPFDTLRGVVERDGFYFCLCNSDDGMVSNQQAIMWLNKLCKDTGAKIVISSTWRRFERKYTTEQCLRNSGLLSEIEVIGATPYTGGERGDEIQEWIEKYYPKGNVRFVILDDDSDMGDLISHLVRCNVDHGFGYPEYRAAVRILEG